MDGSRRIPVVGRWVLIVLVSVLVTATGGTRAQAAAGHATVKAVLRVDSQENDMNKIKHTVFIVQENRSFDEYFGMYPGADGIPLDRRGRPAVCVPDPATAKCQRPYHDAADVTHCGPHGVYASI